MESSNGRTTDSESVYLGSNPGSTARVILATGLCVQGAQKTVKNLIMFYVYFLRTSSNTLYIGQTNNLERRLKEHKSKSSKSSKYIKYFLSSEIVYYEKFNTRSEAIKREIHLKKWTKFKKEELIASSTKY